MSLIILTGFMFSAFQDARVMSLHRAVVNRQGSGAL
jgi:hypothetical protein